MSTATILFIALGLAMDAFAVSISSGMTIRSPKISDALKIAFYFGLFQAFMPLIGWLAAIRLSGFITSIDHWVAFGLLSFIGFKMFYEAIKGKPGENKIINPLEFRTLIFLSVATSIDALAVGISFAFLKSSMIIPAITIGMMAFVLSFLGVFIGNGLGHFLEKKAEIAGGLILIGIGIKILIEHLT